VDVRVIFVLATCGVIGYVEELILKVFGVSDSVFVVALLPDLSFEGTPDGGRRSLP
jgi:hypothetical protein